MNVYCKTVHSPKSAFVGLTPSHGKSQQGTTCIDEIVFKIFTRSFIGLVRKTTSLQALTSPSLFASGTLDSVIDQGFR